MNKTAKVVLGRLATRSPREPDGPGSPPDAQASIRSKKTLLPGGRNLLAKLLETVNFAPSRGGKVRNGRIFL